MRLYAVTKVTESGQCFFDFENQFWIPTPITGKRGVTIHEANALEIERLFKHQDSRLHCFHIDIPQPYKPVVNDSCFLPGVPG